MGPRFASAEALARIQHETAMRLAEEAARPSTHSTMRTSTLHLPKPPPPPEPDTEGDLSWAMILKRTFEAYVRNERPNMVSDESNIKMILLTFKAVRGMGSVE